MSLSLTTRMDYATELNDNVSRVHNGFKGKAKHEYASIDQPIETGDVVQPTV